MRLLGITDLHNASGMLQRILQQAGSIDLVLLGGDITNFGTPEDVHQIVNQVFQAGYPVLAVAGNCDSPHIEQQLQQLHVSLYRRAVVYQNVGFQGLSAMPPWKSRMYHFSEDQLAEDLEEGYRQLLEFKVSCPSGQGIAASPQTVPSKESSQKNPETGFQEPEQKLLHRQSPPMAFQMENLPESQNLSAENGAVINGRPSIVENLPESQNLSAENVAVINGRPSIVENPPESQNLSAEEKAALCSGVSQKTFVSARPRTRTTPVPGTTPQADEVWSCGREWKIHVVLSHVPPRDCKLDRTFLGRHVGSQALRRFIDRVQPDLVVCGHIHEGRGLDRIGRTWILNCGSAAGGSYGLVEITSELRIEIRRL